MYWAQHARVRVDGEVRECQNIKRGIRQDCVLSPDLFSLYGEVIRQSIGEYKGISFGGNNINKIKIKYADDTVLIAD